MQHRLLDEYVAQITPRRNVTDEAPADAEELLQHLSALADANSELGMTEDEAVREAIRQFGVARTVRRELKRANERRRIAKVVLSNGAVALVAGIALGVPSVYLTFSANHITTSVILDAILVAHPHSVSNYSVMYGATVPFATPLTGFFLAFFRGRAALVTLPLTILIAMSLSFVMLSLVKCFLVSWPLTAPLGSMLATTFTSLLTYAYVGAVPGALCRNLWRRQQRASRA